MIGHQLRARASGLWGERPELPEQLWLELVNAFKMSQDEPPLAIQP